MACPCCINLVPPPPPPPPPTGCPCVCTNIGNQIHLTIVGGGRKCQCIPDDDTLTLCYSACPGGLANCEGPGNYPGLAGCGCGVWQYFNVFCPCNPFRGPNICTEAPAPPFPPDPCIPTPTNPCVPGDPFSGGCGFRAIAGCPPGVGSDPDTFSVSLVWQTWCYGGGIDNQPCPCAGGCIHTASLVGSAQIADDPDFSCDPLYIEIPLTVLLPQVSGVNCTYAASQGLWCPGGLPTLAILTEA